MRPIPKVSDIDLAVPTTVATPPEDEIPAEFWDSGNVWVRLGDGLFFRTINATKMHLIARDPEQAEPAWRAVLECMGSWAFKQKHKSAALGYLLSEWFKDYWLDGDTKTRVLGAELDPDFIAAVAEQAAAGKNML